MRTPAFLLLLLLASALLASPAAAAITDTDTLSLEKPDAPLMPRGAAPAFRGLFVLVMPWNTDRHEIEARRKLQFALRLDEPKAPAFQVTLRF